MATHSHTAKIRALQKEVRRCHARLEIDHYYVMLGKKTYRKPIPYKDRLLFPDGISCRDETIKMLDRQIDEYRKKRKRK